VFTLLPILTGEGRAHHGEIMREATRLIEAGKVAPRVDPRHFTLSTLGEAYRALESGDAAGKIVVDRFAPGARDSAADAERRLN
jgi:NADPH:quinone reductase-like Zn-dependent oxidoreductase